MLAVIGSLAFDVTKGKSWRSRPLYVTGIEGDHHNVVGISLPLLRDLLTDLGVSWSALRAGATAG